MSTIAVYQELREPTARRGGDRRQSTRKIIVCRRLTAAKSLPESLTELLKFLESEYPSIASRNSQFLRSQKHFMIHGVVQVSAQPQRYRIFGCCERSVRYIEDLLALASN